MPSNTPLTDAINALTQYANETTGASDTTLSDAVGTLVAGYGGGGGGHSVLDYLHHQFAGAVEYTDDSINDVMLKGQNGITALSFPNVTTLYNLPGGAFQNMTGLITFSAPKATRVANNLLQNCTALTSVDFSKLTDTGGYMLTGCTSLTVLVLPAVATVYSNVANGCVNLEVFDGLVSNGFTNTSNFNNCAKLTAVIIRKSGVASLSNINNFYGTPFASNGTGGTLYVPQAQISSYQSANNWSTILGYANNQIKAIEGSYYETHYADGTPIE